MNLMADILINVIIAFLAGSLLLGLHRKVIARVQLRPGPPIIQHLLHSLKFFFKESSFPKTASMPFYVGIVVILAIIWVVGVIVGPVAHDSLLILFGVYAVYKIVEHNSGSSSGSPYGKLSCVRAVLSAATELPLFAAIVLVYLKTDSMNIGKIIAYQGVHGPLAFSIPLAALMFVIMFSESVSWYVMLWVFLTIFFGPLSPVYYALGMIIITFITGFINAVTPMLNPNHSVMTQITIGAVCFVGTLLMIFV